MTPQDWRTDFEAAEGKAHELVGALETLQREASAYRDLNSTIEGGSESLAKVADSFDEFLPRVDEVMKRMNALGTPELRQDVDGLGKRLEALEVSTKQVMTFLQVVLGVSVVSLIAVGVLLFRG